MKQFLFKVAGYGLMTIVILNGIAFLSLFLLARSNLYKPQFIKNGVPEKEFDYVVLGSSTGLTTLDTKLIDSITGKKGLNISMDDSGLSSHYLMLMHFYEQQKKTKTLILAITPWDISVAKPVINDNDYRFLPHVQEKYIADYFNELEHSPFKKFSLSRYFPLIGVSYYNTELFFPSILAALHPKDRNRFDNKGNYSYPVSIGGLKETDNKVIQLNIKNPYFEKIKQICSQQNTRLVLYLSPMYKTTVETESKLAIVNHSDLFQDSSMFYDNIHVNVNGRRICSEKFANYMQTGILYKSL